MNAKYKCVGHPASVNKETDEPYKDEYSGCGNEFEGKVGPSQGYRIVNGEREDIPTGCTVCGSIYVEWTNHDEMTKQWEQEAAPSCPLCDRPLIPGQSINDHHLVPVSKGGKEKFAIHVVCHSKIHHTFTEKELADTYHTWEALRGHPEMKKFVKWICKKDPEFLSKNKDTQQRKRKRRR